MPRLWIILLIVLGFFDLSAQSAPDSIFQKLDDFYLSGRFREGLDLCEGLLKSPLSFAPEQLAFIHLKQGLFLKDVDQYHQAFTAFETAKNQLRTQADTLSLLYCELLQHSSYAAAAITKWTESEAWAHQGLKLAERLVGTEHPLYALALFHVGYINNHRRRYPEAEFYFNQAASLQLKLLGENHRDYAQTIHFTGSIKLNSAHFSLAKKYFEKALTIRRKVFWGPHPRIIALHMNMGLIEAITGKLEEAELLFRRAKKEADDSQKLGIGASTTTNSNLANVLIDLGKYAEARQIIEENIQILLQLKGKDHPDYSMNLQIMAATFQKQGNLERAQALLEETLEHRERQLGQQHPYYAESLGALGNILIEKKEWAAAVVNFEKTTALMERIQGIAHPDYANNLFNWGYALFYAGQKELGLQKAQTALQILEKAYGNENLNFARTQYRLASLLRGVGDLKAAYLMAKTAGVTQQKLLIRAATYFSENDLETYTHEFSQDLSKQFSLLAPAPPQKIWEDTDGTIYNNLLFYKGFVAQQVFQLRTFIRQQGDSTLRTKLNQWQELYRQIGQEYAKTVGNRSPELATLEQSAAALEKELAQAAKSFVQLRREVHWADVQQELQAHEAAIEFFRYQPHPDNPEVVYAAAVIRPGWNAPRLVHLCQESELGLASRPTTKTQLKNERGIEPVPSAALQDVYRLIWEPLNSSLLGVKTIYYSPIGILNTLPLHALSVGNTQKILSDRYDLVLMHTTRNLVAEPQHQSSQPRSAFLVGGVNYDRASKSSGSSGLVNGKALRTRTVLRSFQALQDGQWINLPGSAQEINQLQSILQQQGVSTTVLKDTAATEEAIKGYLATPLVAPEVIHLATHGFAFQDTLKRSTFHYTVLQNPLLRSGLVLAGANDRSDRDALYAEDGILTAYEVSGFNVQGTKLVVLSACDSGLGEIRQEEGVYGLSRAFKMAGAKALLLSLWEAPDEETAEFMTDFYRRWLNGSSLREAFWKTRKKMQKRHLDPQKWAGFVLWE